ncbi:MAG: YeeE/YedE family protein [Kangiellaceae bacterium]|jgi:uncharacterized protein
MTEFTPVAGLVGGLLIGLSAAMLLIFAGRIAGISGIVNGMFTRDRKEILWRGAFVVGLIIGPVIASNFNYSLPTNIEMTWPQVILGGIFVGLGTNLANGCTSGHGVCGIGRFSSRSIIATAIFMLVAMITVWLMRNGLGELL